MLHLRILSMWSAKSYRCIVMSLLLNVHVGRNNSLHIMVIFSGNGLWASMINSNSIKSGIPLWSFETWCLCVVLVKHSDINFYFVPNYTCNMYIVNIFHNVRKIHCWNKFLCSNARERVAYTLQEEIFVGIWISLFS